LQQDDYVAARHAWNFHELFVLWRDSLLDNDTVTEMNDQCRETTSPDQQQTSLHNGHQSPSQICQQPDNTECNRIAEPIHADLSSGHNVVNLSEAVAPSLNDDSSDIVAVDRTDQIHSVSQDNGSCEPEPQATMSMLMEVESMDEQEDSDLDVSGDQLDSVASCEPCPGSSDTVQHLETPNISICQSSHENSYCYFCALPQSEIQHHLKFEHGEEDEITELASLPSDAARVRSLRKLMHLGNHRHNRKVLQENRGTFLVLHQPEPGARPECYSPCKGCWNYMTKAELSKHACKHFSQESKKTHKLETTQNIKHSTEDRIQIVSRRSLHSSTGLCYFCGHWFTKVCRHWLTKHLNEPEVMQYLSLGLTDNKVKNLYGAKLQNLAVHEQNVKVLKKGRGRLFVARVNKCPGRANPTDYLPCENCWAYLVKHCLWKHQCMANRSQNCYVSADAPFLLPTQKVFHDQVGDMLEGMMDGNLKLVAASDPLIGEYMAKLLSLGIVHDTIMRNIRLLARFVLEIRTMTGLCDATVSDSISPLNFERCVLAVKSLRRSDRTSLAFTRRIGNMLRQLSKLLKRDAMKERDTNAVKDLDEFAALCLSQWKSPDTTTENDMHSDVELDSE